MKKFVKSSLKFFAIQFLPGIVLASIIMFIFESNRQSQQLDLIEKTKFYSESIPYSITEFSLQDKVKIAEEIFGTGILGFYIPEFRTYKNYGIDSLRKDRSKGVFSPCQLNNVQPIITIETSKFDTVQHEITKQKMEDILKTYPKNWVEGEISGIVQDTAENNNGWADCSYDSKDGSSVITFRKSSLNENPCNNIHCAFSHEMAHANDWQEDNNLLFEERITLLMQICERLVADDRYISSYVEKKASATPEDIFIKATEYWAEICQVYFTSFLKGTHGGSDLNVKDVKIIESIIVKDDPDYDVMAAYYKRCKLIAGYGIRYRKRSEYIACNWPTN